MTSSGRLFQTLGPAEANEWSPTVTSRDGRMSSRLEDVMGIHTSVTDIVDDGICMYVCGS